MSEGAGGKVFAVNWGWGGVLIVRKGEAGGACY